MRSLPTQALSDPMILSRGRQELVKQIEKNAEERALRAEQKDQESQEVLRYLEQLKMDEQKVCWAGTGELLGSRGG